MDESGFVMAVETSGGQRARSYTKMDVISERNTLVSSGLRVVTLDFNSSIEPTNVCTSKIGHVQRHAHTHARGGQGYFRHCMRVPEQDTLIVEQRFASKSDSAFSTDY